MEERGGDTPAGTGAVAVRQLAITARAVEMLTGKLASACAEASEPVPRDDVAALEAQARALRELFDELAREAASTAAAAPPPAVPSSAEAESAASAQGEATPVALGGVEAIAETETVAGVAGPEPDVGIEPEVVAQPVAPEPEPSGGEPAPAEPHDEETQEAMRLTTLDLATAGHDREAVAAQLREYFSASDEDVAAALDQVFGAAGEPPGAGRTGRRGRRRGRRR